MKIIVCVKQVPDSAATMSVEDGKISWGDAPLVINPWDEYAVEAALRLTEAQGGEVVALSLGDENAKEAIKHALAMGCSEAILVNDPAMAGADTQAVARVLAAAIQKIGDADIVVFGKQAIDSDVGATPAMVARLLGWPALTLVSEISECSDSADQGRPRHGRRPPAGRSLPPGGTQHRQGLRRAALSLLHGDPQSCPGRSARMDCRRYRDRSSRLRWSPGRM